MHSQEAKGCDPLYAATVVEQGLDQRLLPPEFDDDLPGFELVQQQVVSLALLALLLHLVPVCGPVSTQDAAHHGGVVCILCDVIAGVDGGDVVCIEGVEQGAQHAALRGPGAESEGCGVWEPTCTLWGRSDRKSLIQVQVNILLSFIFPSLCRSLG